MAGLQFTILEFSHGWATLEFSAGRQHTTARCSDIYDSLGDLIRGLAQLTVASGKFEIICDTENRGLTLLAFVRKGNDLEVTAKREYSPGDAADARRRRARLRYCGDWRTDLLTILSAMQQLLDRHGKDGYCRRWSHPFPEAEFAQLKRACDVEPPG